MRTSLLEGTVERWTVEEIGVDELDALENRAEVGRVHRWLAADDAGDLVPLREQELGEEGAVLPSHSGDERAPLRDASDDTFVAGSLTESLRRAPPSLHRREEFWGLAWEALGWLEQNVQRGMRTLETGAGASTLVFAASGAEHQAVTPDPDEERRVREACAARGIDDTRVTFHIGRSQDVLPKLPDSRLDLVLVDGAHGFPYPILDWWYLAPLLRAGGRMLLDDAYLSPVAAIVDYVRGSATWELEKPVSFRTACIRKLRDDDPPGEADALAAHGRMSFAYLPPARRLAASARMRVFSTRAGIWLVRKLRAPS